MESKNNIFLDDEAYSDGPTLSPSYPSDQDIDLKPLKFERNDENDENEDVLLDIKDEPPNTSDEEFINDGDISEREWTPAKIVRFYTFTYIS